MQTRQARTFFFIPPLRKTTGGVAVICRMAAFLREAGHEVALALYDPAGWRPGDTGLPEVNFSSLALAPEDLWVVPEGWVNALAPGLSAGARCLAYVQNWAYLFTGLPSGVDWRELRVTLVAVSRPVAWFMEQSLGLSPPILRPGIDLGLFAPNLDDRNAGPGLAPDRPAPLPVKPDTLSVAYMPRKNKALAEQIRAVIQARGRFEVKWVEIAGLDQAGVAAALRECHAFLATGFPEGCPLPPLEAMASGAIPAGFAGFGGWDYMRQTLPGTYAPECPLDQVPWSGNGFYAPDNDVLGAALALEKALEAWRHGGDALRTVLDNCARTAKAYGLGPQREAVLDFWERLG
jgi:hypothetical protein